MLRQMIGMRGSLFALAISLTGIQAGCGGDDLPLGEADPPSALRVRGVGTANILATATTTAVEGEIVIPNTSITGRLQIDLLTENGGPFRPPVPLHPTVTSSDGEVAFWLPDDNSVWLGQVVGARRGSATLQISILTEDRGVVFRAAPIPVRFAEP